MSSADNIEFLEAPSIELVSEPLHQISHSWQGADWIMAGCICGWCEVGFRDEWRRTAKTAMAHVATEALR